MQRLLCLAAAVSTLTFTASVTAQPQLATATSSQPRTSASALAASVAAPGDAFSTTIQGNALTPTNGFLVDTNVRLRDARYGRVVATQVTDKTGLFAFRGLEPGSYIVELVSPDQSAVLAASQIINVNAGEVVSAVVKLPFEAPRRAGIFGDNGAIATPGTAKAVLAEAAANGVLVIAAPHLAVTACPEQSF